MDKTLEELQNEIATIEREKAEQKAELDTLTEKYATLLDHNKKLFLSRNTTINDTNNNNTNNIEELSIEDISHILMKEGI